MRPAFDRGDILFLTNTSPERHETGDIVVYKISEGETPIVHRVMETHPDTAPKLGDSMSGQLLLTKGDNNPVDDLELYKGSQWLEGKHVVGKVQGYVAVFISTSKTITEVKCPGSFRTLDTSL